MLYIQDMIKKEQSCTKYDVIRYKTTKLMVNQDGNEAKKNYWKEEDEEIASVKGKEVKKWTRPWRNTMKVKKRLK